MKEELIRTFENITTIDEGVYFTNLEEIAENPQIIKNELTLECWQSVEYSAGEITGRAIVAGEFTKPNDLVLNPALSGWHRIYISTIHLSSAPNTCVYSNPHDSIYLKLTNDKFFSVINGNNLPKPVKWGAYECVEEKFWKCADLTGEKLIIKKPDVPGVNITSCISWLRFVKMTEEEILGYKKYIKPKRCMHIHYDSDAHAIPVEELGTIGSKVRFSCLGETDAEICSHEYWMPEDEMLKKVHLHKRGQVRAESMKKTGDLLPSIIKDDVQVIQSFGIKALAAYRMSMANFNTPTGHLPSLAFVDEHSEYYCRSRLGEEIKICSYAYKQVQDFVINHFKNILTYGYDGITLIMHRGMFFGFEKPVTDRFNKLYPGVNPYVLPISDERLHGVWCSFMNEFMNRLRKELEEIAGRKIYVNVIVGTTPQGVKNLGLDVMEWAKKGYIDSFCQDVMEVYEILDGCLGDDGYIDLEKYSEINKKRPVIVRNSINSEMEPMLTGAAEYQKIADNTGKTFYGAILYNPYSRLHIKSRDELKKIGVKHYSHFNYNHTVPDLTQMHISSKLGHDEIKEEYSALKHYRVLSLDGSDIATFDPNWRG